MRKLYILNLNDKCNNNCLICFEGKRIEAASPISWPQVVKQLRQAQKAGCRHLDIFGGEPTTHSFLPEIIKLAAVLGFSITLASNARMFSYPNYAKRFAQFPIKKIRTSLHSHRKSVHDSLTRVQGSFKQTIAGIKNILTLGIPLLVNIVITARNYRDLPAITHFVKKLGLSMIKYSGLVLEGRCLENQKLIPRWQILRPYLLAALSMARQKHLKIFIEKLPVCFFPERQGCHFVPELMPNFVKLPICHGCQDANRCVGVDKLYLKLFPADKRILKNF